MKKLLSLFIILLCVPFFLGATSFPGGGTGSGSGDVTKVGTPVDNQVTVWTGDGTAEGTTGLTYDGSTLNVTGDFQATGGLSSGPGATPGFRGYDSDAAGTGEAEFVGTLRFDWIDGAEGSENSDWWISAMQAGSEIITMLFDESDDQIEFNVNTELQAGDIVASELAADAKLQSYAVASLSDAATPSVLTTAETINKVISNYKASGADHVFTMPAPHQNGNLIFPIGDEFQVDVEPNTGDLFYLNGTAMAIDEHIQNTADTLGQRLVGYCVNINGTLRWMFFSSDAGWVEETP